MLNTTQISFWSYSAASLAFIVLGLLLALSWRGRLAGGLLIATAIVNACWAIAIAVSQVQRYGWSLPNILESLRTVSWFAFMAALLLFRQKSSPDGRTIISSKIFWFSGALLLLGLLLEWPQQWLSRSTATTAFFAIQLIVAIIGLILIEQLYRNVSPDRRWTIKFLCLGLGALFAYDLILYSDAMLFGRIDADLWSGRGIANFLIVPLIAVSAARNPEWSLEIAVSRKVVLQSSALLGAGTYLMAVAGAGYYIRYFGGSWGGVMQTVVLFAGIVSLILLALSGTLRARLKVFVNKNFFSYRYDYREEWLRITHDLASGNLEKDFGERSIRALANLVESPGGGLWLQQENRHYERVAVWKASGLDGIASVDAPIIRFMHDRQWVINMDEYRGNSPHYANIKLPEWLVNFPQSWLVVPLISQERLLGFVVLFRSNVKQAINWEVNDLLKTAGRQVAGYLAQLEASQALLVARQFESFNRMSAFVIHDLKNLVAQLSLLVTNAAKHRNNPEFQQDMIETVHNASERMKRLLTQLRAGATPVEQTISVNLKDIVHRAVINKAPLHPAPFIQINAPGAYALAHPERLERVVGHLLQNAAEATPQDGSIIVRVKTDFESAIIEVEDTGAGMSSEFIHNHLFQPFESTKQNGMGIGIYESKEYVRELGGKLDVRSREHQGTCFRIILPLVKSESSAQMGIS